MTSRSLDWDDLIIRPGRQREEPHRDQQDRHWSNHTIDDIRHCQELDDHLTEWEREFVNSVAASIIQWGRLTEKQQICFDRIVNKLKLAGLWEGEGW